MAEPTILLTGLAIGESPRWHDGRLWFSNWGTQQSRTQNRAESGMDSRQREVEAWLHKWSLTQQEQAQNLAAMVHAAVEAETYVA